MHAAITTRLVTVSLVALVGVTTVPRPSPGQGRAESLLQLEVGDNIGLPLPDAALEVYTLMDGAVFSEWVSIAPEMLPPGIHLLRFSHSGYRSSVFSVPLAKGKRVSLRVRLQPGDDTTRARGSVRAGTVHAIGLAVDERGAPDVIGDRRVLDRRAMAHYERSAMDHNERSSIGELLRLVGGTGLIMKHGQGRSVTPYTRSVTGAECAAAVVPNGNPRRTQSFASMDQFSTTDDIEVIEVFPRGASVPRAYQPFGSECGVIVTWFKRP